MQIENWKLEDIKPYEQNAKLHQVGWIAKSIEEFHIDQPIVVDGDGVIIKGHGRLKAAQKLGLTEFPVVVRTDLTPEQVRLARIADNRTNEGGWDSDKLGSELSDLMTSLPSFDFDSLGVNDDWFRDVGIDPRTDKPASDVDPDDIPDIPEDAPPITQPGDLWQLGNHRVLCGDSTKPEDVARLMDGKQANGVFTSPPYAEQRKQQYGGIPVDEYVEWWGAIQANIRDVLAHDGSLFVNIKPHCDNDGQRVLYVFELVLIMAKQWGWRFIDEFSWVHNGIPGRVVEHFKNQFEPIYQFAVCRKFKIFPENVSFFSEHVPLGGGGNISRQQGSGDAGRDFEKGHGMAYPGNVIRAGKNTEALGHPAAFPVKLPEFFIKAFSQDSDLWLDPFGGSGTTLIACEQTPHRQARLMEISPRYVDIIVKRWETVTGKQAVLLEKGGAA